MTISRIPEMPGHSMNERYGARQKAARDHEATYKKDCDEASLGFHAIAFDSYGALLGKSHSFLAKTIVPLLRRSSSVTANNFWSTLSLSFMLAHNYSLFWSASRLGAFVLNRPSEESAAAA